MIIDVHHHWMPQEHIENLEKYLRPGEVAEPLDQDTWFIKAKGRILDHRLAMVRTLTSNMLDDFPSLRFVHGHLGGAGFFPAREWLGLAGPELRRRLPRSELCGAGQ